MDILKQIIFEPVEYLQIFPANGNTSPQQVGKTTQTQLFVAKKPTLYLRKTDRPG